MNWKKCLLVPRGLSLTPAIPQALPSDSHSWKAKARLQIWYFPQVCPSDSDWHVLLCSTDYEVRHHQSLHFYIILLQLKMKQLFLRVAMSVPPQASRHLNMEIATKPHKGEREDFSEGNRTDHLIHSLHLHLA